MVYDKDLQLPGCAWTDQHTAQGFARRESVVNFNTLLEFGYADVVVTIGLFQPHPNYERVVAVPFLVTSGKIIVDGPEETNVERTFALSPGSYRLVAAQCVKGDEEEDVVLFFEPLAKPLDRSAVLLVDDMLNPIMPLLETAKVAGEE